MSHLEFTENEATRRYFRRFHHVIDRLRELAESDLPGGARRVGAEDEVIGDHLEALAATFDALSMKYLMTEHVDHRLPRKLEVDVVDSGFPVAAEILEMRRDAERAERKLSELPSSEDLKEAMLDEMLRERKVPRGLQFQMSQRVYHEKLLEGGLFLSQNRPVVTEIERSGKGARYLLHWSVYDRERNFPNVYTMVMDADDRGWVDDDERAKAVGDHLLSQSLSTLKLVTIAKGFDKDFPDMHPKSLKRVHVGPMYSKRLTKHNDVVEEALRECDDETEDWAFCWTVETLASSESKKVRSGLFGEVMQEVFSLDHYEPEAFEAGATRVDQFVVLPYRPYQIAMERGDERLLSMRKYVVGRDGLVLADG